MNTSSSVSETARNNRNTTTKSIDKQALKSSLWEKIMDLRLYGSRSENASINEEDKKSIRGTADYENIIASQERKQRNSTIFVGDGDSGQTSLITSIVNPGKEDKVKPTVALEYSFARRAMGSANDNSKGNSEGEKTVVNSISTQVSEIWDLGGGREMSPLLSSCLNCDTLSFTSLVIVLDLSNPLTCADSLLFWLKEVLKITNSSMSKLSYSKENDAKESFHLLTTTFQYPKEEAISILPLSITVVGNKFDLFVNNCSVACRRLVTSYLRYLCHFNHCNLIFTSVKDKSYGTSFRYIGSQILFTNTSALSDHITAKMRNNKLEEGNEKSDDIVSTLPLFAKDKYREYNIDKLICIGAGYDSMDLILNSLPATIQANLIMPYQTRSYEDASTGRGINSNIENAIKTWDEVMEREFQENLEAIEKRKKTYKKGKKGSLALSKEKLVDEARKEKDEILLQYQKEAIRRRRMNEVY